MGRTFTLSGARSASAQAWVRHPVALFSNEPSIGCQDEVVAERAGRSPATIIDGAEDAQGTARTGIPMNAHLHLICDAGSTSEFSDLGFAE